VVHKESGRFSGCIDDVFLEQSVDGPTRNGALLHCMLTNEDMFEDTHVNSSTGCSSCKTVEAKGLEDK